MCMCVGTSMFADIKMSQIQPNTRSQQSRDPLHPRHTSGPDTEGSIPDLCLLPDTDPCLFCVIDFAHALRSKNVKEQKCSEPVTRVSHTLGTALWGAAAVCVLTCHRSELSAPVGCCVMTCHRSDLSAPVGCCVMTCHRSDLSAPVVCCVMTCHRSDLSAPVVCCVLTCHRPDLSAPVVCCVMTCHRSDLSAPVFCCVLTCHRSAVC